MKTLMSAIPTVECLAIPQEIDIITKLWRPLGDEHAADALAEFIAAPTAEVPAAYAAHVRVSAEFEPAREIENEWPITDWQIAA